MTHFLLVTTFLLGGETEPLRPGFHTRSVEHDGVKRSYLLHVPKGYDASKATPLVLALHGATMNGSTMALFSGMNETGDKHTFVSVYPNGTGLVSTWNAGQFPGALGAKKVDDVGYLAKVLDDVEKTLNIDKKLAAYAGAWFDADQLDYGTFGLYASPNPGVSVEAVEKEVDAILAEVAAKGVTQEELDRSRNNLIASSTYLLDSQDKLARVFGVSLATGQTVDDILNWDKDLATVTVDDVNKAARTVLDRKASVTGVLLPEAKSQ